MRNRIGGGWVVIGCAIMVMTPHSAWAFRSNPPAGRNGSTGSGGASCQSCHVNAAGTGTVEILNAPTRYQADAIYDLVIRVSDSTKLGAGFQFSAEKSDGTPAGTLIVTDPVNTQLNPDDNAWINHNSTGVDNSVLGWAGNGNSADFSIRWQAPSSDVGTVTFWAAGNAINNNGFSSGDFIYLTHSSATFLQVPAVSEWGLAILAIGVLTAGTLALRRPSAMTSER